MNILNCPLSFEKFYKVNIYVYTYRFPYISTLSLQEASNFFYLQRCITAQYAQNKCLLVLRIKWDIYIPSLSKDQKTSQKVVQKNVKAGKHVEYCKYCLLGMTWLLCLWTHSINGYLFKTGLINVSSWIGED